MPMMIALRFCAAGRPATAMPTTTALSPASTMSMNRTCASRPSSTSQYWESMLLPCQTARLGSRASRPATRRGRRMVPRYTRPEMAAIWAPENRFRIWFEIEAAAAEAMAALGTIPAEAARVIRERGAPALAAIGPADLARIDAIEQETRHDVIAFLTWLAEKIGPESRFVHQGMTSSDVLDTCLSVQLTQAADLLLADLDARARRAEAPRPRAQGDAHHRPQPRHPCRAHHVRGQARRALCRVRPQPRPARAGTGARSPSAPSRGPSAPSPMSIPAWRRWWRRSSASRRSRSPPR